MIRNLAVPRHFVSYLVFFFLVFVWTHDHTSLLALKIRTPVANTGKLRSIGQMPVVLVSSIIDSSFYLMLVSLPILLIKCSHLLPNVKTFV